MDNKMLNTANILKTSTLAEFLIFSLGCENIKNSARENIKNSAKST